VISRRQTLFLSTEESFMLSRQFTERMAYPAFTEVWCSMELQAQLLMVASSISTRMAKRSSMSTTPSRTHFSWWRSACEPAWCLWWWRCRSGLLRPGWCFSKSSNPNSSGLTTSSELWARTCGIRVVSKVSIEDSSRVSLCLPMELFKCIATKCCATSWSLRLALPRR